MAVQTTADIGSQPSFDGEQAFAFIERLEGLNQVDAVLDAMQSTLNSLGFERLHFTWIRTTPDERFEDLVLATRWPREFVDLYLRGNYSQIAPLHRLARSSITPFEWNSGTYSNDSDPRVVELMKHAASFRMAQGFIVPVHCPNGRAGVVAMSGVDLHLRKHDKPALHLMALYAFDRVRHLKPSIRPKTPALSARERQVLTWAAMGKSAWEIGEILDIAKRTVDEHIQTAARKLDAVNRTQAVALAIRYELIAF
jgi:LuxR family quorum sensing-dependent transcriptional regulator